MTLPSSTFAITTEDRAAAEARLPINSNERSTGRMAGYQVEQTVEACRSLPSHQQRAEHRTVPPPRSVTDAQLRVVSSPAGQITSELEAEPARALSSDSRTVAVDRAISESDYLAMMDNLANSANSANSANQEFLEILEAATQMLETCQNRSIKVQAKFFSMHKLLAISRHHIDLKKCFEKCNVFFGALNLDVARNTACLADMLSTSSRSNIARMSNSLINMGDTEIHYIAKSPWLKTISSMCHGQGLPREADVKAFLELSCLKTGWRGNDAAVKDKPLDRAMVARISSMCHGKGLPKAVDVKAFLELPCLKKNWLGNDEAVKDKPLDRELVIKIAAMFNDKGLPKEADVKACVQILLNFERASRYRY